jgi:hypothetical protein
MDSIERDLGLSNRALGKARNVLMHTDLRDSDLPALPMVGSRRERVQNDSGEIV